MESNAWDIGLRRFKVMPTDGFFDISGLPCKMLHVEDYEWALKQLENFKVMKEFIEWAVDVSLDKKVQEQGIKILEKLNS